MLSFGFDIWKRINPTAEQIPMNAQLAKYKSPLVSGTPEMDAGDGVVAQETGGSPDKPSRRSSSSLLWRHRALWRVPLASEAVLLAMAAHMALAFGKVMRGEAASGDWVWVLACGAVFAGARFYAVWRELFMPRAVALSGLGLFGFIAAGLLTGLLFPEPWHAAFDGLSLPYRALAGLPLVLFVGRAVGLVRAARFSPALREMDRRGKSSTSGMRATFTRRLEFWMR